VTPAADITLDVDLRNPGQFFACCGVLELAGRRWPGCEGWFVQEGSRASFNVVTYGGDNNPLGKIVDDLCGAEKMVAPVDDGDPELSDDLVPVIVLPFSLRVDWWLDSYGGRRDKSELKIWAGQQTPERVINNLGKAWRELGPDDQNELPALFSLRRPLKGRFGFDPSASWEALDVGFSPDEQGLPVQTSPATEILAAVGLQRCRPLPVEGKRRWFTYQAWSDPVDITVAPAALAGIGRTIAAYEFPVVMRTAQYGSFGWAKRREDGQ
jgi:CRISPR-associated protein Csx14